MDSTGVFLLIVGLLFTSLPDEFGIMVNALY
jgi:hypothetical protein